MKILMVSKSSIPLGSRGSGGAERHAYILSQRLRNLGHEVHLVASVAEGANLETDDKLVIHECEHFKEGEFKFAKTFRGLLWRHFICNLRTLRKTVEVLRNEKKPFDVVHSHGQLSGLMLLLLKKRLPLVFTEHDNPPWMCEYRSALERKGRTIIYYLLNITIFKKAGHIITRSEAVRSEMIARLRIPPEKVTVSLSAIDTDFYRPCASGDTLATLGINKGYCLFVGWLYPRKGADILLRALKDLTIPAVFVGDGMDREKLAHLVEELGLKDRVKFTGNLDAGQVRDLYCGAKFYVLPSVAEGVPTTILESMSCGKPVISSNLPGVSEVLIDGFNGLFFEPGNIEELKNKIKALLDDKALYDRLSQNARASAVQKFDLRLALEETIQVYEKAIAYVREKSRHN